MRHRTAALLFGAAAATGAAAIGAATAVLLGTRADDRVDRAYAALSKMVLTRPPLGSPEPPEGQRPGLVLVKGGPCS